MRRHHDGQGRSRAWVGTVLFMGVAMLFAACGDDDGAGPDAGVDGAVEDGQAGDALPSDGGGEGDGEVTNDGGPCAHEGKVGDPCTEDCDCEEVTPCRGYPGEKVCSHPCTSYDGCESVDMGCEVSTYCDMNIGGCRCSCTETSCPDGECFGSQCVVCAIDDHCADLACDTDPDRPRPRCRPDTQECVCAGECGDGICDEYEEATNACPADCTGPCEEGTSLPFFCIGGEAVEFCRCQGGVWSCVPDPTVGCHGETACAQAAGQCVATEQECYEGAIAADAQGCSGDQPLCCQRETCYGLGETYYPTLGHCCPGLRALPAVELMAGMGSNPDDVTCFASCWSMTCAPCGDGVCQPHYTENYCNCPEDCPAPPYELSCLSAPMECGTFYCAQDGGTCRQHTPSCEQEECSFEIEEFPGQICDAVTRTCVTP